MKKIFFNLFNYFGKKITNLDYFLKWLILGAIAGIIAGIGALAFFYSIRLCESFFWTYLLGMKAPVPVGEGKRFLFSIQRPYLIPIVVGFGGLITGLLVYKFAPGDQGHETADDIAIDAYHRKNGKIRPNITLIKTIASSITIGSGGSAGREGPSALISAGINSFISNLLNLNDADRRKMVAIGIGAGIGTIFKAPIGGALLAAEILYKRDLQTDVIYPAIVASAIGYSIFGSFVGFTPIFGYYLVAFNPLRLPLYATLGIALGYIAILYPKIFYWTKTKFQQLKIDNRLKPAIGGFSSGILAFFFPEIMGVGYGWVQFLINGKFNHLIMFGLPIFAVLIIIAFIKIFATALTVGSGGGGGLFAPGMFIGGFLGAGIGFIFHFLVPHLVPLNAIGAFTIVGMLSFFGAAGKVPIAVILMVVEMTGSLQLLPAAMIAVSISYLISGTTTIYNSQVLTQKDSPANFGEFNIPLLASLKIGNIKKFRNIQINPSEQVYYVKEVMAYNSFSSLPVVLNNQLQGIIYLYDLIDVEDDVRISHFIKEVNISVNYTTSLEQAWNIMTENKTTWVSVVENNIFLGLATLDDILNIYRKNLDILKKQETKSG
ncbi:MAG: chloride channel protein [Candidatus Omnitrophica bacterium]|jgi:CIC family chloride channel protein|nr:chloride channel protein [Candidatus Omnitrophota bacterium]